ncbi:MAG: molybdopterin-dependent oxidoreductase [bacterium]|nr:MAG: molybdopterin-dependent oxidoreductase [bacterium]
MEISRREFLRLLGISGVATTIGAVTANSFFSIPDEVFERVLSGPRIETWKNSICTLCPGGCGIRVRLIDGVPVRVQGNPLYPINLGAVCPMAESGIEMLFHPDRLRSPMKRQGERGENKWEEIGWDEAMEALTERLKILHDSNQPEKLVLVNHHPNSVVKNLAARFMKLYGSPNIFEIDETQANSIPVYLSHGFHSPPAYDVLNSNFILNFGGDFLDEGPSPVRFNQFYAKLKNRKDQNRARLVHVSSYMSRTAAQSSEWVPIKPGAMAALALSIANVMIRDQSYKKEFIKKETFGFENWKDSLGTEHIGFKNLVLEEYYPEKVSDITGIPASKIVEIARDFALTEPALCIAGGQAATSTNSLYTLWSIYCLNALKGNFEIPGGVLFPKQMFSSQSQDFNLENVSRIGSNKPKIFPENICNFNFTSDSLEQLILSLHQDKKYPVDTLIFNGTNPAFDATNQQFFKDAINNVPFIVSCNSFMDETAEWADLILPKPVFLESWDGSYGVTGAEFSHFGVQQPVIEPIYKTKNFGDILLELSTRLGGNLASGMSWNSLKDYIQDQSSSIYHSGEGAIISESVDISWIEFLKKRGWQAFEYSTFDEFWNILLEKGGWWDPIYSKSDKDRIFKTKSGKFEFFSSTFKSEIEKLDLPQESLSARLNYLCDQWKISARNDQIFLPHFESPRFNNDSGSYTYHLLTYQMLIKTNGPGGNINLASELFGIYSREYWNSWVEINPETARSLGINEGDHLNLISPTGKLVVKVKILPTVMPETVVMPYGLGHNSVGKNPHEIFDTDMDFITGIPSSISTMIKIEKVNIDKNV